MRSGLISILYLYCLTAFSQSTAWNAPSSFSTQKNPVPYSSDAVRSGRTIYQKNCSACHGNSGKGDGPAAIALNPKPANHTGEKVQKESDGSLYWKISQGKGAMPGWKNSLSAEQRWNIIHYIRSLNPTPTSIISPEIKKEIKDTLFSEKLPDKIIDSTVIMHMVNQKTESLFVHFQKQLDSLKAQNEILLNAIEKENNQLKNEKLGKNKFLATGSANTLALLNTDALNEFGFSTGFLPLFIWKPSDRLFFESHFHIEGQAGSVSGHSHDTDPTTSKYAEASVSIAYMNLNYFINDHITLTTGYFPTPFGIYNERMHADWINKLPDAPLGTGHGTFVSPSTEMGIQLRGGARIGKSHINYCLYTSNGPQIDYTSEDAGKLKFGSVGDNNINKAVGGRLGILPFRKSTFELGLSGQYAKTGDDGSAYENVGARMYAADLSFNANLKPLKGSFTFKSQFAYLDVDNANYTVIITSRNAPNQHNIGDTISYYFINTSHTGFAQASFRPSLSKKNFIKNLELVVRFDEISLPKNALWTMNDKRWALGINYWIEPRTAIKLCYEVGQYRDFAMVQFVTGF